MSRILVAALGAVLLLGTQAPAQTAGKTRIVFANFNDEHTFGASVLRGIHAAAKNRPDVEILYLDNKSDAARAVENARNAATVKPDVFISYNTVPAAGPQIGRILKDANVPVLSVQVRVPGTPLYAVDNELSGYAAAKAVADAAKAKFGTGTPAVLLLTFPEGGPLFIERTAAARKAVAEAYPDAKIEEQSTKNDPSVARQHATDFLTRNPNAKIIIWAHVDSMGIAALTAARNASRADDVLISATGGDASTLPEIRRAGSSFVGTFSFFPELWGNELIDLAVRLAKKETLPETIRPKRQLFLSVQNVDQFYPR
jgi:ribose transport system substrate-binding protein